LRDGWFLELHKNASYVSCHLCWTYEKRAENPPSLSGKPITFTIKAAMIEPLLCDFSRMGLLQ
jgi:hypothetical protein